MSKKLIGIIGGGVWGSALAKTLSENEVLIYARDENIVSSINNYKLNPKLKYVTFNKNVKGTNIISNLYDCEYVFIAIPTKEIRQVMKIYKKDNLKQNFIIGSKGIEINTKKFPYDIVKEVLNTENISVLSGPCFSSELAQNMPTAATLAAHKKETFDELNSLFTNKNIRLYYSDDIIGCQLGGALKNIYAIASGISMGLNLGDNARSSLITRSFSEMSRFAKFMKADPQTLFGLSGLGDLICTAYSKYSRNRLLGELFIKNKSLEESNNKIKMVSEGLNSSIVLNYIINKNNLDMPICKEVYRILFEQYNPEKSLKNLMLRDLKREY